MGFQYDEWFFIWNLDICISCSATLDLIKICFSRCSLKPLRSGRGRCHLVTPQWRQKSMFSSWPPLWPMWGLLLTAGPGQSFWLPHRLCCGKGVVTAGMGQSPNSPGGFLYHHPRGKRGTAGWGEKPQVPMWSPHCTLVGIKSIFSVQGSWGTAFQSDEESNLSIQALLGWVVVDPQFSVVFETEQHFLSSLPC